MTERLTDRIRTFVMREYVAPARRAGKKRLTVRVRDVRDELGKHESMTGKSVVICQALQSKKFMEESSMLVESIDGPPSKLSPTVVMHYTLVETRQSESSPISTATLDESPEAWASRVTGKVWGLLREEIGSHGGAESFIRWVRSEEKE